jgi:hypothetical protein
MTMAREVPVADRDARGRCPVRLAPSELFIMTTAFAPQPAPARIGPSPVAVVAVVFVAALAFVTLVTAGITFVALAIAFPIAVPMAEHFHVAVTATDAAIAQHAAGFWWAFVALAFASFGAATLVVAAAVRVLGSTNQN